LATSTRKPFREFSARCESRLRSCRTALSVTLIIAPKNTAAAYPSQNRAVNHQVSTSDTRGNLNIKNRAGYHVMLSGAL
jgi:hypothetical protein